MNQMLLNSIIGQGGNRLVRQSLILGAPFLVILAALWFFAYGTGVFPYLGKKVWTERWAATPLVVVSDGVANGMNVGTRRFVFLKGQRIFVDYDLKRLTHGSLDVHIVQVGKIEAGGAGFKRVDRIGRGRVELVAPATGIYAISVKGSPDKNGYDLSYSATWGAYFPAFDPGPKSVAVAAR